MMDDRIKRIRAKRAADTIGRKMDKDNMPMSKAMQKKKKKSSDLLNSLMGGIKKTDAEDSMKYMEGGAVKKYMGGGKVRGYKDGGGVCRGGGAAVSGTKFSGVK